MATKITPMISVLLTLANGRRVQLTEGDIVKDLVYRDGNSTKTINGAVRIINGNSKSYSTKLSCPPESYISNIVNLTSIIIDSSINYDAELTQISLTNIIDIGSISQNGGAIICGIGNGFTSLTNVIDSAPAGSTIELLGGEYQDDLTITKSLKLISKNGAVISGKITVNGDTTVDSDPDTITNIELTGLYLTNNSTVVLNNVDTFVMKDCVFEQHSITTPRTMLISVPSANPIELVVENNIFGIQNENAYHVIDAYGKLKNDSSISGNKFLDKCCTHNIISLYEIEDGTTLRINNNYCEYSANLIRIGFKGEPKGIIDIADNTYVTTSGDEYAGMLIIQPYGTQTTTFGDLTVNINNTTKPEGQLLYLYSGKNDMVFTEMTKPVVYVDGIKMDNVPVIDMHVPVETTPTTEQDVDTPTTDDATEDTQ